MMKQVVVTGVNRGLGNELFRQLSSRDYFVYGIVRSENAFLRLVKEAPANSKVLLADVSRDDCMEILKDHVHGQVDLLINNAGTGGRGLTLSETMPEELNQLFNVHCVGAFRVTRALKQNLQLAAEPVVINISSRMGSISRQSEGNYRHLKASYAYRISKAAQNMLTACMRAELGEQINFISLHPGKMKTRKAQADADLEPSQSARRIIAAWEGRWLTSGNGMVELPDNLIPW
jgi:NAD(P)-dependent dehydrogenase (short-subunit alcohol dehydrogenase family)